MMIPSGAAAREIPHGIGDVLNPTAGTELDCGLFAGGVFKSACWCLQFPSLCSTSDYQAAVALAHPELVYGTMPLPVPPPAVSEGTSTVPAPYTADEAQAAIDAALLAGQQQTQQQNSDYFMTVQRNLDTIAASQPSVPSWVWLAAVGIGALMLLKR
jgi:hypothetical protein